MSARPSSIGAFAPWVAGTFDIACWYGVERTKGYLYRGLALKQVSKGSPQGRRPPIWNVTHLGSGHAICALRAASPKAFEVATEIAECGDWSFDGLKGYLNRDPELPFKVRSILDRHDVHIVRQGGQSHEEHARQIAQSRA